MRPGGAQPGEQAIHLRRGSDLAGPFEGGPDLSGVSFGASSMANIRQTWAPCRRRGKQRFSGCLISRPMPGHRPAGFGREAAGAYGPGASRTRRRFVVQIGRGTGETSGRRPSATRPRRMRDSDATHPRQLDRPICTDALQVLSASGPIVPRHETFLSSAVGRPQLAGASGAVSAAGPHRAARTPAHRDRKDRWNACRLTPGLTRLAWPAAPWLSRHVAASTGLRCSACSARLQPTRDDGPCPQQDQRRHDYRPAHRPCRRRGVHRPVLCRCVGDQPAVRQQATGNLHGLARDRPSGRRAGSGVVGAPVTGGPVRGRTGGSGATRAPPWRHRPAEAASG